MKLYRSYKADLLGFSEKVCYFQNENVSIDYAQSLLSKDKKFKIDNCHSLFDDKNKRIFSKNCFLKNEDSVNFLADSFMVCVDKVDLKNQVNSNEIYEIVYQLSKGGEEFIFAGNKQETLNKFYQDLGQLPNKLHLASPEDLEMSDYKEYKESVVVTDNDQGSVKLAKIHHWSETSSEYSESDVIQDLMILRKCEVRLQS